MADKPIQWTPKELLKAKKAPDIVDVPARSVFTIAGAGPPEDDAFATAVAALYGVSYGIRFARKKAGRDVFKVGVLEGEWWAEGVDLPLHDVPARERWCWRLRMAVPPDVTEEELHELVEVVTTKRGGKLEGSEEAKRVQLEQLPDVRMARLLHIGPYSEEPASFAEIDALLASEGLTRPRRHVEVYLSDPSRTAPEKLKTTLLVEVEPA